MERRADLRFVKIPALWRGPMPLLDTGMSIFFFDLWCLCGFCLLYTCELLYIFLLSFILQRILVSAWLSACSAPKSTEGSLANRNNGVSKGALGLSRQHEEKRPRSCSGTDPNVHRQSQAVVQPCCGDQAGMRSKLLECLHPSLPPELC